MKNPMRSWMVPGLLAACAGTAVSGQVVSFDNSCGNGLWNSSCTTFIPPSSCICDNNWTTGTVNSPNCQSCPAHPGAGDDVVIGATIVTVNNASPIRSLATSVLFINQYIVQVTDSAYYGGPVHSIGGSFGGGTHTFTQPVTIAAGSSVTFREGYHHLNAGMVVPAGCSAFLQGDVSNPLSITWHGNQVFYLDGAYAPNIPGGILRNVAGATFLATGNGQLRGIIGLGHFLNSGTFTKDGGSGTTEVHSEFINAPGGQINVRTGTLRLINLGNLGGTIALDAGTTLDIDRVYIDMFLNNLTVTGDGLVRISNGFTLPAGTTTVMRHVDAPTHRWYGPGMLRVTNTYNLGGNIESGGQTVLAPGCMTTIANHLANRGGPMRNSGTVLWQDGSINFIGTGVFINEATGVFECRGNDSMGGNAAFTNHGRFGRYADGGLTASIANPFVNRGVFECAVGQLYMEAFTQESGITRLSGGTLAGHYSNFPLVFNGGTLSGSGQIPGYVFNNGADLAPGSSTGVLSVIVGNGGGLPSYTRYTQGAAASASVEIGGLVVGTGYDRLNVSAAPH